MKKIILFIHTNKIVRRRLHSAGTNWLPFNDKSMSEIDSIFYNFFHMVHFAQLCTFEWYTLLTFPVIHIHIIYILQPSLRLNVFFKIDIFLWRLWTTYRNGFPFEPKNGENITKPHRLTLFPPNFRRIGKTMIL